MYIRQARGVVFKKALIPPMKASKTAAWFWGIFLLISFTGPTNLLEEMLDKLADTLSNVTSSYSVGLIQVITKGKILAYIFLKQSWLLKIAL